VSRRKVREITSQNTAQRIGRERMQLRFGRNYASALLILAATSLLLYVMVLFSPLSDSDAIGELQRLMYSVISMLLKLLVAG